MKSKIFGVLALIAVVMAGMFFGLFAGTWFVYGGFLMLLIAVCFIEVAIEAHPKCEDIKNRIADIMTED